MIAPRASVGWIAAILAPAGLGLLAVAGWLALSGAAFDSGQAGLIATALTAGVGVLLVWLARRAIRAAARARRRARALAEEGIDLPARLIEVFRDANVTDSRGRWFRIACEADWPATGAALRFESEPMPTDPSPRLASGALMVRVHPEDPGNFAVIIA